MESWRQHLNELDDCPTQPISVGDFKIALKLSIEEPSVQKDTLQQMKDSGERIGDYNKIFTAAGLLSAVPMAGASAGLAFGAALLGTVAFAYRAKQEKANDKIVDNLLALLCIDNDLLEVVHDNIETEYWKNSDLKDRVEAYANSADDNEPMPNFTQHFIEWLNTQSDYSADTTGSPNTQVIEK
jgi:hypothetical protein